MIRKLAGYWKHPESRKIIHWFMLLTGFIVLHELFVFASWWPLQKAVNTALNGGSKSDVLFWMVITGGMQLIMLVLYFMTDLWKHNLIIEFSYYMKRKALEYLGMRSIAPRYNLDQSVQIASNNMINSASALAFNALGQIGPVVCKLMVLNLVFLYFGWQMAAIAFGGNILVGLIVWLCMPAMKRMEVEKQDDIFQLDVLEAKWSQEYDLKYSMGVEHDGAQEILDLNKKVAKAEQSRHIPWNVIMFYFYGMSQLSTLALLIYTFLLARDQFISVGVLCVLMMASNMYLMFSKEIQGTAHQVIGGKLSWDKITSLLIRSGGIDSSMSLWPERVVGNISLRDVSVVNDSNGRLILDQLSFDIPLGSKLVICCPNAGGKSTFLNLLQNAVDYSGSVMVDGVELRDVDSRRYRNIYPAVVLQKYFVGSGTVFDNLVVGNSSVSRNEAEKVLQRVGFNTSGSEALSLDYALKDFGAGLSEGQKQRIAIARMLLRSNTKICLLDEPTSSLDSESTELVLRELEKLAECDDKTVIITTHSEQAKRLNGFQLVELKNGKFNISQAA